LGGVLRDSQGNIIRLYTGSLGNSTNNAVEFGALEIGLEILHREAISNAIVEGDSMLVINTVRKLQNGNQHSKEIPCWKRAHKNYESPQQPRGYCKKNSRGLEEPKRKAGAIGREISPLPPLHPPYGHHSCGLMRNTNQHQKDMHGEAEGGKCSK